MIAEALQQKFSIAKTKMYNKKQSLSMKLEPLHDNYAASYHSDLDWISTDIVP